MEERTEVSDHVVVEKMFGNFALPFDDFALPFDDANGQMLNFEQGMNHSPWPARLDIRRNPILISRFKGNRFQDYETLAAGTSQPQRNVANLNPSICNDFSYQVHKPISTC